MYFFDSFEFKLLIWLHTFASHRRIGDGFHSEFHADLCMIREISFRRTFESIVHVIDKPKHCKWGTCKQTHTN